MPSYEALQTRQTVLYTTGTLVANGGSVNSGFINVAGKKTIQVTKAHTTGTYTMTVAWSRDGTVVDFSGTLVLTDNVAAVVNVAAPYVRFTIAATGADFTVHRTTVYG